MTNIKFTLWNKNFKFKFGDHDILKSYRLIFQNHNHFTTTSDDLYLTKNKIITFDNFATKERSDEIEILKNNNNKLILVLTEYFVKKKIFFKNQIFINYFSQNKFFFFLSVLHRLLRKINRNQKVYFFFSFIIFLQLQYQIIVLDPDISIKLLLSCLLFLTFQKSWNFIFNFFFSNLNFFSKINEITHFSDRKIGIKKISPYIDAIIFADENVKSSYLENKEYIDFFKEKKNFELDLLESLKIENFKINDISKKNFMIFGERTTYRLEKLNSLVKYLIKVGILQEKEAKNLISKFNGDFKADSLGNGIGIIIPKQKNNPYLSTGSLIRHFNSSNIPVVFSDIKLISKFDKIPICKSFHDFKVFYENFEQNLKDFLDNAKALKELAINNNKIIIKNLDEL